VVRQGRTGVVAGDPPEDSQPVRKARTSALRDLVIQAPAPVVADAPGFHQTTATRQFTAAGGTWSRYAASRRPPRGRSHDRAFTSAGHPRGLH
jgi:hypothetical protein